MIHWRWFSVLFGALLAGTVQPATRLEDAAGVHWPSFRGPAAAGIAAGYPTPVSWDVPKGRNVLWKTAIAGLGHSSPVIWGDRVFVTTAISGKEEPELKVGLYGDIRPVDDETVHAWKLYCLDKGTGKILWQRTPHKGVPQVKRHPKATHANSTPATDGRYVVVFFGSEGLFCYDVDGKLVWKKSLGLLDSAFFMVPSAQWGFASSPVIDDGKVYVQCDVLKGSFLAAFELGSGKELWRTARNDVPTWSTPAIHTAGGRKQVIVNGFRHMGGYDAATGAEIWRLGGGGDIPVPTPVVGHGHVYLTNAHGRMAPIYAVRLNAKGDISLADKETSNAHIAWSQEREGAYMQTPIVVGDHLYNCRDNGVLSCYEARSGRRLYQVRLGEGGGFTASAVSADGKLYYTSEEGEVFVVKAGPEFELLSRNPMGEVCMATPAISEGVLFYRTRGHLVAIGAAGR